MSNRNYQVNVPHTFATHLLLSNLYSASVANDTFISDSLVLSAVALIVFNGTKNALAEKTVTFRLIGTVVYGFGF